MEPVLLWIIAGFALVIVELITGTFYLLVIGVGAFAGAVVAWSGASDLVQAVGACAVALVGALFVHHWHAGQRKDDAKATSSTSASPWSSRAGPTRPRASRG